MKLYSRIDAVRRNAHDSETMWLHDRTAEHFFASGECNRAPLPHSPHSGAYAWASYQEGEAIGKKMKVSFNSNVMLVDVSPFRILGRGLSTTDDLNLKSTRKSAAEPASHWRNQSLATYLTVFYLPSNSESHLCFTSY